MTELRQEKVDRERVGGLALRPVVRIFAEAMERRLRANEHKGGWERETPLWLLGRADEERIELQQLLGKTAGGTMRRMDVDPLELAEQVLHEAADSANFLMMVADQMYRVVLPEGMRGAGPVAEPQTIADVAEETPVARRHRQRVRELTDLLGMLRPVFGDIEDALPSPEAVEDALRELLADMATLRAENERMKAGVVRRFRRETSPSDPVTTLWQRITRAITKGREWVDTVNGLHGYDSMAFAEARKVWLDMAYELHPDGPKGAPGGGKAEVERLVFWRLMQAELDHAYAKHGAEPWGRHEFYGILMEEVLELQEAVFRDHPTEEVLKEAVQVAAMCLRYAETHDRYRGAHPRLTPWRDRGDIEAVGFDDAVQELVDAGLLEVVPPATTPGTEALRGLVLAMEKAGIGAEPTPTPERGPGHAYIDSPTKLQAELQMPDTNARLVVFFRHVKEGNYTDALLQAPFPYTARLDTKTDTYCFSVEGPLWPSVSGDGPDALSALRRAAEGLGMALRVVGWPSRRAPVDPTAPIL